MYLTNLTPLHQPPTRLSLRPPKEPVRRSEAIDAERARRSELEREQQRVATRAEVTAVAEQMAGDLRRARDIHEPGYTAGLIIAAGRKARGELPEEPRLTGLAAQIVFQGKVRRGEVVADAVVLPENSTARAVTFCGRRRRGEALSDAEQTWLDSFLKRVEG